MLPPPAAAAAVWILLLPHRSRMRDSDFLLCTNVERMVISMNSNLRKSKVLTAIPSFSCIFPIFLPERQFWSILWRTRGKKDTVGCCCFSACLWKGIVLLFALSEEWLCPLLSGPEYCQTTTGLSLATLDLSCCNFQNFCSWILSFSSCFFFFF